MRINKGVTVIGMLVLLLVVPIVSAGVGIKTTREALLVDAGKEVCVRDYSVYNPWPEASYVTLNVSGGLENVLQLKDMEPLLIPADTYNEDSIPVEFCFEIPEVYEKDCLIGEFLCEQTCSEPQVSYSGDVVVMSVANPADVTGSGGSATKMAVSAPLNLRVTCEKYERKYTAVYIVLAIVSLMMLCFISWKKYKTPESVRKKEKMAKLKAEMKKLKSGK